MYVVYLSVIGFLLCIVFMVFAINANSVSLSLLASNSSISRLNLCCGLMVLVLGSEICVSFL